MVNAQACMHQSPIVQFLKWFSHSRDHLALVLTRPVVASGYRKTLSPYPSVSHRTRNVTLATPRSSNSLDILMQGDGNCLLFLKFSILKPCLYFGAFSCVVQRWSKVEGMSKTRHRLLRSTRYVGLSLSYRVIRSPKFSLIEVLRTNCVDSVRGKGLFLRKETLDVLTSYWKIVRTS